MAFLYIENFEAGLDTRRAAFTAPPGSLRRLHNAHITRGREVERRKAFASVAELPAGTFGLTGARGDLYVFGSGAEPTGMPALVRYQQLAAPGSPDMVRLWDTEVFGGLLYTVAEFDDGTLHHFYDGNVVSDWATLAGDIASKETVAAALDFRLENSNFVTAFASGDRIVLTGEPGQTVSVTVSEPELTVTETQTAVAEQGEVRAEGSFEVLEGSPGQTFNTITAVRVDGVDLIGSAIDYELDNATTAQAVADRINAFTSGYQASASGAVVTVIAPPGFGASLNGVELTVATNGDVDVGNLQNLQNGADPVDPVPQITEVTVATFSAATLYEITVESEIYRIEGVSSAIPTTVRAVKQKMYAAVGPLLYFSGFAGDPPQPDPTKWINDDTAPVVIGAGFIDTSTQFSSSENLTGLGVYQNRLVAFGRNATQIWSVDPDPAQNAIYQVLINVGVAAPNSIQEYGDLDIFFLSDSGVRSMRARDSSNLASANDVGVSIDAELTDYMASLPRAQVFNASAVVEPNNNRYLLAVGERIYVFSNFPGSRVAAWSTYDLGALVLAWSVVQGRLYVRTGNSVRLYGGLTGDEYDDSECEVILPFLDAGSPAGRKRVQALDVGASGTWQIDLALEPNFEGEWETTQATTETTYGSFQRLPLNGRSTHFALRFTSDKPAPALIGNAVIEFTDVG